MSLAVSAGHAAHYAGSPRDRAVRPDRRRASRLEHGDDRDRWPGPPPRRASAPRARLTASAAPNVSPAPTAGTPVDDAARHAGEDPVECRVVEQVALRAERDEHDRPRTDVTAQHGRLGERVARRLDQVLGAHHDRVGLPAALAPGRRASASSGSACTSSPTTRRRSQPWISSTVAPGATSARSRATSAAGTSSAIGATRATSGRAEPPSRSGRIGVGPGLEDEHPDAVALLVPVGRGGRRRRLAHERRRGAPAGRARRARPARRRRRSAWSGALPSATAARPEWSTDPPGATVPSAKRSIGQAAHDQASRSSVYHRSHATLLLRAPRGRHRPHDRCAPRLGARPYPRAIRRRW